MKIFCAFCGYRGLGRAFNRYKFRSTGLVEYMCDGCDTPKWRADFLKNDVA